MDTEGDWQGIENAGRGPYRFAERGWGSPRSLRANQDNWIPSPNKCNRQDTKKSRLFSLLSWSFGGYII
jgi:hypothetical protein